MVHIDFKILSLLMLLCLGTSCSTADRSSSVIEEDKLYVTRIYMGNYLDYRHTSPDMYGNPDLIWITTTLDSIHGKISAYSKECEFTPGERIYLRRVLSDNRKNQEWIFQIENSSSAFYRIYEYQRHNTDMVSAWFNSRADSSVIEYTISPGQLAQDLDNQAENSSENY